MDAYQISALFEGEGISASQKVEMLTEVQQLLRQQLEEELALFEKPSLLTHLHTSDETIQRLVDYWQAEPNVSVFVVTRNHHVCAFLAGQLKNDIYNNQDVVSGEVLAVFVAKAYRNQGLGTSLLDHAQSWFKAHDAYSVNVSWLKGNDPSGSLYRKFGFEPVYTTGRKILGAQ
ncbi:MAG: GNAT family N-acetyltransferase [Agarilytica sp.]